MAGDPTAVAGDDQEELFHQHNRALIERRRKELEARRAELEKEQKKNDHWMKCPKCGQDMEEIELLGILVDQCGSCEGIYFDKGEMEILFESEGPTGFLSGLKRMLRFSNPR
ncbi:MAG: hypothetical protein AMXMBFR75_23280 [Candidatus Hinthialibacteria bacterium]|nr:zf-TFIIB domain-containing protein [Candidatus Omnitrophota bacterium]